MGSWNPWRDLRGSTDVTLVIAPLPAETGGGVYVPTSDGGIIALCSTLTQVQRRCVLAHETIHHEHGGGSDYPGMPSAWRAVAMREERRVDDEAVRRLVPMGELLEFCVRVADAQGSLGPREVAEEFDVTEKVAERALLLLQH